MPLIQADALRRQYPDTRWDRTAEMLHNLLVRAQQDGKHEIAVPVPDLPLSISWAVCRRCREAGYTVSLETDKDGEILVLQW